MKGQDEKRKSGTVGLRVEEWMDGVMKEGGGQRWKAEYILTLTIRRIRDVTESSLQRPAHCHCMCVCIILS